MRNLLSIIVFLIFFWPVSAQIPPEIQWRKCYGGSQGDVLNSISSTNDGGYIMIGNSVSDDGDLTNNKGNNDVWVLKIDAGGNIQWQKNYGGSSSDLGSEILPTPDGGYIFLGETKSNDGDVTGNHGDADIWVVKLTVNGAIAWGKCYGGSLSDDAGSIQPTPDGGYIIGGFTNSPDGDVTGLHSSSYSDSWVLKIDGNGNIQWEKCLGGTLDDDRAILVTTNDGGYFMATQTGSSDADVTCTTSGAWKIWMLKMDNAGNIQWQNCWNTNLSAIPNDAKQTADGGFVIAGLTGSLYETGYDAFILKLDATGNLLWSKLYGGSGPHDGAKRVCLINDGGYALAGFTNSNDRNICSIKGGHDYWILKLDSGGMLEWQKTYGGTKDDEPHDILTTADGGFIVAGYTHSSDWDITGNYGTFDGWLVKLGFPGIPVLPTVSISANNIKICPQQAVTFIANSVLGGDAPSFQWQINGINTGPDHDTVKFNNLNNGDVVSCVLTSNSACVTTKTATSNPIAITVDPSKTPANFLPADTALCDYGVLEIKSSTSFLSYLWNTGENTASIKVKQPGIYWLEVVTASDCSGRDSILVIPKECLKGFYMPTAFTPNGDGKNEVLKPFIGGNIIEYQLRIFDRWGQMVFETSQPGEGWDGTFKGQKKNNDVFVWVCQYQFAGEEIKLEKGTVTIIR